MKKIFFLLFLCVTAGLPLLAQQSSPLTLHVEHKQLFRRERAPIALDVTVMWSGEELLEGSIIIRSSADEGAYTYKGPPISMLKGERKERVFLPPAGSNRYRGGLVFNVGFELSNGKRKYLEQVEIGESPFGKWVFSLGMCVPPDFEDPLWTGLNSSFSVEDFDPEHENFRDSPVGTYASRFYPDSVGIQPLEFIVYDVMVIHRRSFAELKKKQLEALAVWVECGGSICVMPGKGLQEYHAGFLNRLAGSAMFSVDAQGRITYDIPGNSNVVSFRTGLGRSAVVLHEEKLGPNWNSPEWMKTIAFLWKLRNFQCRSIEETGKWVKPTGPKPESYDYYSNQYAGEFSPGPLSSYELFNNFLLSPNIRVIPFGLVLLFLIIFVIIIGPVEYIVLGYFKIRKYTWYVFPAVCILFSILTILMANHYMGSKDYFRSVRIIDIAESGKPLRENRFDMGFTAANRMIDKELRGSSISFLNYRDFYRDRYYYGGFESESRDNSLLIGRIPGSYSARLVHEKWSPRLTRYMTFYRDGIPNTTDSDIIEFINTADGLDEKGIREEIFRKNLKTCVYGVYSGNTLKWQYTGDALSGSFKQWIEKVSNRGGRFLKKGETGDGDYNSDSMNNKPFGNPYPRLEFNGVENRGLFSLMDCLSPGGGDDFADLSLFDSSDPQCRMLLCVRHEGDEITIYRKLIYTE